MKYASFIVKKFGDSVVSEVGCQRLDRNPWGKRFELESAGFRQVWTSAVTEYTGLIVLVFEHMSFQVVFMARISRRLALGYDLIEP